MGVMLDVLPLVWMVAAVLGGCEIYSFCEWRENIIGRRTCIWDRGGCPMLWIIILRIRSLTLFDI